MISEYLKHHTAQYHDAAEKLFNSEKIFNKTFTFEDYKKMVYANYLMLQHSEDRIFNVLSEKFSEKLHLKQRRKLPLIEKDIESLSLEPGSAVISSFDIDNEYEALGMLYVIEGSTLGGNVIAKQLSKTEGFDEVTFHFFGCYQENTGSMWKNFKEILDAEVAEENYDKVLSGAKKLYSFLLNTH
ncbi:heme oxygenase [Chryseobacterium defluvii]|uniref:Heme oxygenase n=1 Tax=Chryseobacterium defluvii TaxID=160396 RepID=A0A840KEZ9_9FLAO|nr:biliverdin-producing heme oxygenase [Chryseobacterium defluvii]MBB4806113.1 heme oxygenase [Chryseobacterium defluvii]